MTKKDMINKIIRNVVYDALHCVYGFNMSYANKKQIKLVDKMAEGIYNSFKGSLKNKELKNILDREINGHEN